MKKIILVLALIIMAVPFLSFAAFPVNYNAAYDITDKDGVFKNDTYGISVSATRPIKPKTCTIFLYMIWLIIINILWIFL